MAPYCKSDHRLEHAKHHTRRSYCTSSHRYHRHPQQAFRNVVHRKANLGHTTNSIIAKKSVCDSHWRCMFDWGMPPQLDHGCDWIFTTTQTWIAWWPTTRCWWDITSTHEMGYASWWIRRCFYGTYTTAPQTNLTSNKTTRPTKPIPKYKQYQLGQKELEETKK